ncbi:hypothetical protein GCM10025868_46920 [Angustibacter aerolatus]|uniref:HTH marR-type domain-containing protein n=1 Tax=Angustibacter aerolatus TaxID=1162965 RepID=A0ABQ6JMD6_9ACTN|nr:hypothetical protein GCM10025868_46920 [Angustibacter aerolatus]
MPKQSSRQPTRPPGLVVESRRAAALHRLALLEDGNDIVPVRQQRMLRVLDARPGLMLKDLATALGMTEPAVPGC